ncbi:MAG: VanZ family protein [Roseovarius sp.]|nr:VanZ family protein [Roseovarius sp.]
MAPRLTLILALAIAMTTLMPSSGGTSPLLGLDKLAHLVAFALLVMPMSLRAPHLWPLIWIMALAYGGLIEIVQPYVGRGAEWADLVADGLGAALGVSLGLFFRKILRINH